MYGFADGLNIEDDEPPPEPAPPEIPPRGHSLLRSTSTSARKCSDYQIHVRDVVCADQKHEEFIPQEKQQGKSTILSGLVAGVSRDLIGRVLRCVTRFQWVLYETNVEYRVYNNLVLPVCILSKYQRNSWMKEFEVVYWSSSTLGEGRTTILFLRCLLHLSKSGSSKNLPQLS